MAWTYRYDKPAALADYPTVGGGNYTGKIAQETLDGADHTVASVDELHAAFENAASGDCIYVTSSLDVTGMSGVSVDTRGLTLAGDRGHDGSDGALLSSTEEIYPMFDVSAADFTVTGLSFEAPEDTHESGEHSHRGGSSEAFRVGADGFEAYNCRFRGFGHGGVVVGKGGTAMDCSVHHSEFVDCPRDGLGYGVTIWSGHVDVFYCYLDNCRHKISGDGAEDCSYTFENNYVGGRAVYQAVDMHANHTSDRDNGGEFLHVRHNVIEEQESPVSDSNDDDTDGAGDRSAIYIRGNPLQESRIEFNAFGNDHSGDWAWGDALEYGGSVADSNIVWGDNQTGNATPESDAYGIQPDPVTGSSDGSNSDGSDSDEHYGPPPSDSDTMENPTTGRDGETYNVRVHGTGDQSAYVLVAAEGLREVDDSLEDNDVLDGRGMLGRISTLSDTLEATGPIETFACVRGPTGITLEVDGTEYPPEAFDCPEQDEPAGQLDLGTMDVDGTTYDAALDLREQTGGSQ